MKKSRELIGCFLLIGIIFSIILLFFCTGLSFFFQNKETTGSPSHPEAKEDIILHYYVWDDESFYATEMVENFNAQSDHIKINLHVLPGATYDDNIIELMQNEKIPSDIIDIRGIAQYASYADSHLLSDITGLIRDSQIDITKYGNMYSSVAIDNAYFGMPTRSTCWVLIYNKDIFEHAGEPCPQQLTWEEYRELAKHLTNRDPEGEQVYGGLMVLWNPSLTALQKRSYLTDDDLSSLEASLKMLNNLINTDSSHIPLSALDDDGNPYMTLFESGSVAMMPMGEWFVGMIKNDEEEGLSSVSWDLAPMPVFSDVTPGTTWGQYQMIGITESCRNPEAAWQFVQFVSGEQGAAIYARNGMLSAYQTDAIKEIYKNFVGNKNTDVFFDAHIIQEVPAYKNYTILQNQFKDNALEYLTGNVSLEQAMQSFNNQRAAVLQPKGGS